MNQLEKSLFIFERTGVGPRGGSGPGGDERRSVPDPVRSPEHSAHEFNLVSHAFELQRKYYNNHAKYQIFVIRLIKREVNQRSIFRHADKQAPSCQKLSIF
jgi:hypothetical protein